MTETLPPENSENKDASDAAWVTLETPFDATGLAGFLNDVERLFRINSQLVFTEWKDLGDDEYQLEAKNLSNGKTIEARLRIVRKKDGIAVFYSDGLKTATTFHAEQKPDGTANLVVMDDYSGTPAAERKARIDEVDKSLVQWGRDLRLYLLGWKRWSWLPGWQWYMRRVWQPMRPMARRVCYMLILITLLEFFAFLMVFTVFWLELDKYLD